MLRFNSLVLLCYYYLGGFQYILCYGSTAFRARRRVRGMEFQYILCYGSTIIRILINQIFFTFQYILCYGSTLILKLSKHIKEISIHPMLRFNSKYRQEIDLIAEFQYILCYGSTVLTVPNVCGDELISIHPMLRFNNFLE